MGSLVLVSRQQDNTSLQVFKFVSKEKSFSTFQSSNSFFPKLFSVGFKSLLFFLTEFHLSLNFLSYTSYSTYSTLQEVVRGSVYDLVGSPRAL